MAKVSIIIPVYNVEKYLRQCLESVRNQTLKEIEIICVDDGSTDASGRILDEYAETDKRIRVIHKENEGYGKAVNLGIETASAPYIGIVESDDWVACDMYESLYAVIQEQQVDIVKSDFFECYGDGKGEYIEEYAPLTADEHLRKLYGMAVSSREHPEIYRFRKYTWTGLYRKSFLQREHVLHNETPGASFQDQGFWFLSLAKAESIYFVPKAFYRYRIDNTASSMYSKEKVFTMFEEYDYIFDNLGKMGEYSGIYYKWGNYHKLLCGINHIGRVADEYKTMLAERVKDEFLLAADKGQIDASLFSAAWKEKIFDIIVDSHNYVEKEKIRSKKVKNAVKGYDIVILYGAGRIGHRVWSILKEWRNNVKLKYFAVTETGQNPESIHGVPVKRISDLLEYRDCALVVISVGQVSMEEVGSNLKKYGFQHFIPYTDLL